MWSAHGVTSGSDGGSALGPIPDGCNAGHLAAVPIKPNHARRGHGSANLPGSEVRQSRLYHRLEEQVAAAGLRREYLSPLRQCVRRQIPFGASPHWYAGQHDRQNSVVDALFKAYLSGGADIGSQAVLADLAASAGLEAARFLQTEEGAANVKAEEVAGRRTSASIPTFS